MSPGGAQFLEPLVVDWRRCVDCGEVFRSARPWCVECLANYGPDRPWLQPEWQVTPEELRARLLATENLSPGERAGTWLLATATGAHWMASPSLRPFVSSYGRFGWTVDFEDIADSDLAAGAAGMRLRRAWLDEPLEARLVLGVAYGLALPGIQRARLADVVHLITGEDAELVARAVDLAGRRADREVA